MYIYKYIYIYILIYIYIYIYIYILISKNILKQQNIHLISVIIQLLRVFDKNVSLF